MVQRKDSLCFVEFMRGKYDLQNLEYLLKVFSGMTPEERDKLENLDFEELWQYLWSHSHGKNFMKEHQRSKEKFNILKTGYLLKRVDKNDNIFINITYMLQNTTSKIQETEWGFPKGRRNRSYEDDRHCALREFREETSIDLCEIRCRREIKPFEEVFTGSNKVRYKHVYYIAYASPNILFHTKLYNPDNKCQSREIRNVKWFDYEEAQQKILPENVERKELLKRIHNRILAD